MCCLLSPMAWSRGDERAFLQENNVPYLVKPFEVAELISQRGRLLQKAHAAAAGELRIFRRRSNNAVIPSEARDLGSCLRCRCRPPRANTEIPGFTREGQFARNISGF